LSTRSPAPPIPIRANTGFGFLLQGKRAEQPGGIRAIVGGDRIHRGAGACVGQMHLANVHCRYLGPGDRRGLIQCLPRHERYRDFFIRTDHDNGHACGFRARCRDKVLLQDKGGKHNGASGLSFTKNAITLSAIPVGAGATAVSSSRIVITWPLVTGAALYKIYRNTVDTGAFTLADSVSADTFSDTNSAGGTTYYYKISAVNGSGESGLSAPCSTLTFPGVPSGVSAAGDFKLGHHGHLAAAKRRGVL